MYLGCTRIILMYTANLKNQEKNGKTVKFAKKYKIDTILILFNPLGPVSLSRYKKKYFFQVASAFSCVIF